MCISNNSKVLLIAKICIEMNDNSKVLLLDAIMLKANSAPNSMPQYAKGRGLNMLNYMPEARARVCHAILTVMIKL